MILSESLKSAREFAKKHNIPDYIFKKFDWVDFTPTKKYFNQVLKWYLANPEIELLDRYFIKNKLETYDTAIQNIDVNRRQIESFKTWEEFEKFIDEYSAKNEKPEINKNVIFENDKVLIIRPGNKETVCKYGKGTQWCITMNDQDMADNDHYNRYRFEMGFTFYYCIIKDKTVLEKIFTGDVDKYMKMCAIVNKGDVIEEVFDSTDERVDGDAFYNVLNASGISDDDINKYFISIPITFSEKMNRILDSVKYTIHNNKFTIDGDLDFRIFYGDDIKKIPIKLDVVHGSIYAGGLALNTTENFPRKCRGISIHENYITEFSEGMEECETMDVSSNSLISTKNIPMIKNELFLSMNPDLKKLEGLSHQSMDIINLIQTGLESLEGIPHSKTIYCSYTKIKSLNGLQFENNVLYLFDFRFNLELEDIEILKNLPDSSSIYIIRLTGCNKISKKYAEKILKGKKVGRIIC